MKYRIKRVSEDTLDICQLKSGFKESYSIENFKKLINDEDDVLRIVSLYQKASNVFCIRYIAASDDELPLYEDEFILSLSLLRDEEFKKALESALEKFQKYRYEDFWRINAIKEDNAASRNLDYCRKQIIDTYFKQKRIILPNNFSYKKLYKSLPRGKKDFEMGVSFKNKFCDISFFLLAFVFLILGGGIALMDFQFAFNQLRLLLSASSFIGSFAIFNWERKFYNGLVKKNYDEFRSAYVHGVKSALKQDRSRKDEAFMEIFDEILEYMQTLSDRNFDSQIKSLEKLKSRFEKLVSLVDRNTLAGRFDILDSFLEIERQVHCLENSFDTKVASNDGLTLELFYKHLSFLGCDRKFCEKDCHLSMLSDCYCEILIYPYSGCKHDLITIIEAAVYYLRTILLYSSEEAKSDAQKRARDIVESIAVSRELDRKCEILTSSSEVLKSLYFSENTKFDLGKQISLK